MEVSAAGARTVLQTPTGLRDLDVAADLAVAGAFRPGGDPGFSTASNPVVYLGSLCLVVGGAMLAAVVVHRRRVTRRGRG